MDSRGCRTKGDPAAHRALAAAGKGREEEHGGDNEQDGAEPRGRPFGDRDGAGQRERDREPHHGRTVTLDRRVSDHHGPRIAVTSARQPSPAGHQPPGPVEARNGPRPCGLEYRLHDPSRYDLRGRRTRPLGRGGAAAGTGTMGRADRKREVIRGAPAGAAAARHQIAVPPYAAPRQCRSPPGGSPLFRKP